MPHYGGQGLHILAGSLAQVMFGQENDLVFLFQEHMLIPLFKRIEMNTSRSINTQNVAMIVFS
jgi:hypothetical protein